MSTPIYLGIVPSGADIVPARVKAMGLNLVKTSPNRLGILGISHIVQHSYASYSANIPAFLKAYILGVDVPLNEIGYQVAVPDNRTIPLPLPSVIFTLTGHRNGNPPEALHNRLMELSSKKYVFDKKTYYSVAVKEMGIAREVFEMNVQSDCKLFTVAGVTNFDGLLTFRVIQKMFSAFFHTNQYPAFYSDGVSAQEGYVWDLSKSSSRKRKSRRSEAEVEEPVSKRRKEKRPAAAETEEEEGGSMEIDESAHESAAQLDLSPSDPSHILRAKKPVKLNERPWGGADTLPDANGVFVAFVLQLTSEDPSTLIDVVRSYFARFLANSSTEILAAWGKLNKSWYRLMATDEGKMLTHMALGIRLSLSCQAVCYPVLEGGEYLGFALMGDKFSVVIDGVTHTPKPREQVQQAIEAMSTHPSILRGILNTIKDAYSDEDVPKPFPTVDDIVSFRQIYLLSEYANLLNVDERMEIREQAKGLFFRKKYMGATFDTISTILRAYRDWDAAKDEYQRGGLLSTGVPESFPMAPSVITSTRSPFWLLLSVFGEFAPSPCVPGGTVSDIRSTPACTNADTEGLLCFFDKPLAEAVNDWEKMVETGKVVNNPRGRAVSSKFRSFKGQQKMEMGQLMMSLVDTKSAVASGSRARVEVVPKSGAYDNVW